MQTLPVSILLVEDNPGDGKLVDVYLSQSTLRYNLKWSKTAGEGIEELKSRNYDVLLLDLSLPDSYHDSTLETFLKVSGSTPVIVLTGDTNYTTSVQSVRQGAQDFLSKNNLNPEMLQRVIAHAIERGALLRSLRESEDRYKSLVENSADAIVSADPDMRISLWNKAAEKLFGYEAKEIMGESLLKLVPEKQHNSKMKGYSAFMTSGSGKVLDGVQELTALHRNGTMIPVECSIAPIKQGASWTATAVIRDITNRRIAEENEKRMAQELQNMQRLDALGILAGGIAHDFNNILTTIMGTISLIRECCEKEPETALIDRAHDAAIQAKKLAGQLLTFSEGGKPVLEVKELGPLIVKGSDFALSGSGCGSELSFEEGVRARVDGWQIIQVISNLVMNAAQAMGNEGVISISLRKIELSDRSLSGLSPGSYALIQVKDGGVGIPPEKIDRIFEPFYTSKETGHGLGLSVCFSVVNNHGGAIKADSIPGKETVFSVYLPLCEKHSQEAASEVSSEYFPAHQSILIMDDEEGVRLILKNMLIHLGMEVTETTNGRELIDTYFKFHSESRPFDIVITDLTVPGGIGGKEATGEILALHPDAKVIVSSGYSNSSVLSEHAKNGFCGVLNKPFTIQELKAVLFSALDQNSQENN